MCGLSAIVDFGAGSSALESLLAMHARIPHRGPDGEGFLAADDSGCAIAAKSAEELRGKAPANLRVGLAFRWLQIQDPGENAAQPMASPDGQFWLIFNGEIYNFRELGQELEGLGHRFASVGDTEVILAAYRQWGSGCFSRLNGMWAIILIDLRARKLILSRDRFGIKPLFYHHGPDRLIVASEVKQLLAAGAPATANRSALARFIVGSRPATPEQTFFQDICAQPAATYAEISLQSPPVEVSFVPYWRLEPPAGSIDGLRLADACARLEDLLAHSVAEHMVAQFPLGHLISGGLDSSLLAALAAPNYAQRGQRGMGASMVMTASPERYDESSYIDQVTAALGFDNFKAELSPAWLKDNIARVTVAQEEPVAGMAVAAQYLAYETAARHGARIVLDGQGADEIFAGYPRHQYTVLLDYWRCRSLGPLLRELMALLRNDARFFPDVWRLRVLPRLARAFGLSKGRPTRDFLRFDGEHAAVIPTAASGRPCAPTALSRDLETDILTGNLRPALAVTDRNAMAHSVEARVPYVDRRIVEFAAMLPDDFKIGGGRRKRILRLIAARYLPESVVMRVDRIGFGAPIDQWLMQDFRTELAALPDGPVFSRATLVDPPGLKRYIDGFLAGGHHDAGVVWRLFAIDQWVRAYAVGGL